MNIDRHNYEEYFILYVDSELGSDDRRQVEEFVQKHPDLKEELELLLQYKMVPDTSVVFNGKEELMIHDASPITFDNYEEWLVLYMDNELNAEQKKTVEEFIAAYPSVKQDLAVLQRTKLQPEKIIFTNKETLYRKTADRSVIAMRWLKIAAAAVLIFAIGLATFVFLNKKSGDGEIVVAPKVEQTNKESPVVNNNSENKQDKQPVNDIAIQKNITVTSKQKNNVITKHNKILLKKQPDNITVKKEEPVIVENQKPSNNLPTPTNNPETGIDDPDKSSGTQQTDGIVTNPTPQPSQVVYNPSDNGKKGKLRGLLRKVTRTFEKTTNINPADDENRVLVGGLALKLN